MIYQADITYRRTRQVFEVEDCGYGIEWAKVRAIAHFFFKNPGLEIKRARKLSAKESAPLYIADGLKINLL